MGYEEKRSIVLNGDGAPDVVSEINREHELCLSSMRSSLEHAVGGLEHAMKCGELLLLEKSKLSHGEWLPWVMVNCRFSEDTAERYMKLSRYSARVRNMEPGTLLTGALRMLVEPKRTEPKRAEEEPKKNVAFSWFKEPEYQEHDLWLKRFYSYVKFLEHEDKDRGAVLYILGLWHKRLSDVMQTIEEVIVVERSKE